MAVATSSNTPFSDWLGEYLSKLNIDIDVETYGEYIVGLLKDESMDRKEIIDSIGSFLESLLPPESALECSKTIYTRFHGSDNASPRQDDANSSPSKNLDDLEEQMRALLISTTVSATRSRIPSYAHPFEGIPVKDSPSVSKGKKQGHAKERDPCTAAVLRDAGVSGYQLSAEEEAALQVALADAEFFAKQSTFGDVVDVDKDMLGSNTVEEEIDLAEIEEAQGYVKKEGIKPGNVMDALSTLNPDQFSSSKTAILTPEELKSKRHIKRMPTPGEVNSSTTPGYLLLNNNRGGVYIPTSVPTNVTTASDLTSTTVKKKSAAPSKHLAEIGARAEEKHRRMMQKKQERLSAMGSGGKRLDDMDAFFISDDDDDGGDNDLDVDNALNGSTYQKTERKSDILSAGGSNGGQAKETGKLARVISGREYLEKKMLEKPDCEQPEASTAKRKTNAPQKSQKMERRRR